MLETVKERIKQLIAAYETEKMERIRLQAELEQSRIENETCRKQIIELERQIDNLNLSGAFMGNAGNSIEAKKKVNALLKEIDKCIKLIEG